MTLTLELSPDLEASVRDGAAALGITPEAAALEAVRARYAVGRESDKTRRARRLAALRGSVTGKGPTVDEFLAERQAEAEELNGPAKSETPDERRDRISAAIGEAQKHFAPLLHGGDAVSQLIAEKRADVQREVERGL